MNKTHLEMPHIIIILCLIANGVALGASVSAAGNRPLENKRKIYFEYQWDGRPMSLKSDFSYEFNYNFFSKSDRKRMQLVYTNSVAVCRVYWDGIRKAGQPHAAHIAVVSLGMPVPNSGKNVHRLVKRFHLQYKCPQLGTTGARGGSGYWGETRRFVGGVFLHSWSPFWEPEGQLANYTLSFYRGNISKKTLGIKSFLERTVLNPKSGFRQNLDQYGGSESDQWRHGFQVDFDHQGKARKIAEWRFGQVYNGMGHVVKEAENPFRFPTIEGYYIREDGRTIKSRPLPPLVTLAKLNIRLKEKHKDNVFPHPLYTNHIKAVGGDLFQRSCVYNREILNFDHKEIFFESMFMQKLGGPEILHGPTSRFWPGGKRATLENFKQGKHHGRDIGWLVNGQVAHEGNWKDGFQDGRWTYYWPEGKKLAEINYRDGLKIGPETYWDWRGNKILERTFDNAGAVATETLYHFNSKEKRMEAELKAGHLHGVVNWKSPKGKMIARGEWREGKQWNGMCVSNPKLKPPGGYDTLEYTRYQCNNFGEYRQGKLIRRLQIVDGELKPYESKEPKEKK